MTAHNVGQLVPNHTAELRFFQLIHRGRVQHHKRIIQSDSTCVDHRILTDKQVIPLWGIERLEYILVDRIDLSILFAHFDCTALSNDPQRLSLVKL